jgi:hypothetical protein
MIISHTHKLIFVAIPKTATHAIRFALRPHLAEDDLEQVGLFVKKQMPFEEVAKLGHGHIKCADMQPVVGDELWKSYFKFAIVRNPFDRFISYCAFVNVNNPKFEENPTPYLYNALLNKQTHKHILFIPQSEFVCDKDDNIMIDFVGKYEELQKSYDTVCSETGLEFTNLDVINSSKHRSYKEYYNEELVEMVKKHYYKDFVNFNYSFQL